MEALSAGIIIILIITRGLLDELEVTVSRNYFAFILCANQQWTFHFRLYNDNFRGNIFLLFHKMF